MATKKNILTASGAAKLVEELRVLKEERRPEIAQKIKEARAQGDLSENAEYDAAKDEQGEIESRIEEIEAILKQAEIVEDTKDNSVVSIGATVTLKDLEYEDEMDVTLVGSTEADSLNGKISSESPLGTALMQKKIGDVVTVSAPAGDFKYEIVKIQK